MKWVSDDRQRGHSFIFALPFDSHAYTSFFTLTFLLLEFSKACDNILFPFFLTVKNLNLLNNS